MESSLFYVRDGEQFITRLKASGWHPHQRIGGWVFLNRRFGTIDLGKPLKPGGHYFAFPDCRKAADEILSHLKAMGEALEESSAMSTPVIKFLNNHVDHHSGQNDYVLYAYDDSTSNKTVHGYISYSEYQGVYAVNMLEVHSEFRRMGTGKALVKELERLAKAEGAKIKWGYTTPEGAAALRSAGVRESRGRVPATYLRGLLKEVEDPKSVIRPSDVRDLNLLLNAMTWMEGLELSEISEETGLSPQRIRSLCLRYGDYRFKKIHGRLAYIGSQRSSHAKGSPGITNPRTGSTSGTTPGSVWIDRRPRQKEESFMDDKVSRISNRLSSVRGGARVPGSQIGGRGGDLQEKVDPIRATLSESSSKIEVGDKVRYSSKFCRNTGQYTGDVPFARGVVISIERLSPSSPNEFAIVDWQGTLETEDGKPLMVHVGNLEKVRG